MGLRVCGWPPDLQDITRSQRTECLEVLTTPARQHTGGASGTLVDHFVLGLVSRRAESNAVCRAATTGKPKHRSAVVRLERIATVRPLLGSQITPGWNRTGALRTRTHEVSPTGLEPVTVRLEGGCSIQLS